MTSITSGRRGTSEFRLFQAHGGIHLIVVVPPCRGKPNARRRVWEYCEEIVRPFRWLPNSGYWKSFLGCRTL